jgi:lipopolysaccharide/colanic/teichoic acid biosynthesis glycosyltransferase
MYQQIGVELVQRFDPLALTSLVRDRSPYFLSKRLLDITLATIGLVVLFPLIILIALLIVIDSGWPIIFAQKRVGANRWTRGGFSYWQQTTFTFCKFRSMVQDADPSMHRAFVKAFIHNDQKRMAQVQDEETQTRKLVNDPRVTRVGRFLRRTSLDELPQLWNVVKGDMSLVGPRPPIPYEVDEYSQWQCRRLETKPGLTGLWQVTARSSADFDEMVKLDIDYIENQSFGLDIRILFETPFAVLGGKGAV